MRHQFRALKQHFNGDTTLGVLKEVGTHVARLAVLSETLDEVRDVGRKICAALGIEVIEPETSTLIEAARQDSRRVSFNDRLCFLVCRERGWTCVTNDGALRGLCRRHNVEVRYGLGLMVDLVARGAINRRRAVTIARRMQKANPLHINERVLERFFEALSAIWARCVAPSRTDVSPACRRDACAPRAGAQIVAHPRQPRGRSKAGLPASPFRSVR